MNDNKEIVAVVSVDLSNMFDNILHNMLLPPKLKVYVLYKSASVLLGDYSSPTEYKE